MGQFGIMAYKAENMFDIDYSVQLRGIDLDRYGRFPIWWLLGIAAEARFLPLFVPKFSEFRKFDDPEMIIVVRSQNMRMKTDFDVPLVIAQRKWPAYLYIKQQITSIGNSSYNFLYDMYLTDNPDSINERSVFFAEGGVSLVCAARGRSVPIPKEMRESAVTLLDSRRNDEALPRSAVLFKLTDDQLQSVSNVFRNPKKEEPLNFAQAMNLSSSEVVEGGLRLEWRTTIRPSDEDFYRHLTHYVYLKMVADLLVAHIEGMRDGSMMLSSCAVEYLRELTHEYTGSTTLLLVEVKPLEEESKNVRNPSSTRAFIAVYYSGDSRNLPAARLHSKVRMTITDAAPVAKVFHKTLGTEKAVKNQPFKAKL
eukprot:GDKJ01032442.1.p1 GENE.GDKJ01032442.1~~GDKJ01032442.1.p1  ORF type:complete len:366 (-),score=77.66 GDKJ01032442.1:428-1525(-)